MDEQESRTVRAPAARASPEARPGPAHDMLRARRRRRWALLALLFPAIFFAVVAFGVASMFYGRMSIFRPAPAGSDAALGISLADNLRYGSAKTAALRSEAIAAAAAPYGLAMQAGASPAPRTGLLRHAGPS